MLQLVLNIHFMLLFAKRQQFFDEGFGHQALWRGEQDQGALLEELLQYLVELGKLIRVVIDVAEQQNIGHKIAGQVVPIQHTAGDIGEL